MKHQKGTALIVVLSLLTVSLMVGLSSMQSSQIDERLAGNYKLQAQAEMNSESTAVSMLSHFKSGAGYGSGLDDNAFISCPRWSEIEDVYSVNPAECHYHSHGVESNVGVACHVAVSGGLCGLDDGRYIFAIGSVMGNSGETLAQGSRVIIGLMNAGGYSPDETVHGCEGVTLTGSATILGGVVSGGDINISGGGAPPDNAKAHGEVKYPSWWVWDSQKMRYAEGYENGIEYEHDPSSPNFSCDPLGIDNIYENVNEVTYGVPYGDVLIGSWPRVNAVIDHRGVSANNLSTGEDEVLASMVAAEKVPGLEGLEGTEFQVIKSASFNQHNGSLRVTGGQDYLLFVDGDLTIGAGGDQSLIIDEGSTLTIVVKEKVLLDTALDMLDVPLTTNGKPTFSIYSIKRDEEGESSFIIDEDTHVTGNIYAPYSNMLLTGSSTKRGAMRGKTISVSGAGLITNENNNPEDEAGSGVSPASWNIYP